MCAVSKICITLWCVFVFMICSVSAIVYQFLRFLNPVLITILGLLYGGVFGALFCVLLSYTCEECFAVEDQSVRKPTRKLIAAAWQRVTVGPQNPRSNEVGTSELLERSNQPKEESAGASRNPNDEPLYAIHSLEEPSRASQESSEELFQCYGNVRTGIDFQITKICIFVWGVFIFLVCAATVVLYLFVITHLDPLWNTIFMLLLGTVFGALFCVLLPFTCKERLSEGEQTIPRPTRRLNVSVWQRLTERRRNQSYETEIWQIDWSV